MVRYFTQTLLARQEGPTKRITHIWWNENPLVKQAKQVELSEHRTGNGGKGATDKAASDGQKTTGVNKVDTEEIVCEVLI